MAPSRLGRPGQTFIRAVPVSDPGNSENLQSTWSAHTILQNTYWFIPELHRAYVARAVQRSRVIIERIE